MIIKKEFLKETINYKKYIDEQNVVADYNGDQTQKINYESKYFKGNMKKMLDIGCRDGKFIHRYSEKYEIYGIDIGENARIRAEKLFGKDFSDNFIKIYDVQNEGLKDLFDFKFDFINFSHVIEHLLNPSNALDNIKKIMHKDTEMLIIIPGDLPRFKTIQKCIRGQPFHEIFWENKDDIIKFLKENDLNIINLEEVNLGEISGEWRILVKLNLL